MKIRLQINDRFRNATEGFTLLEVLVAILILSIGLLGMASLTVGIIQGNKFSQELTTAATLAKNKMEDMRKMAYSEVTSQTRTSLLAPYALYQREVIVTNDSPASGMKTVVVRVYWGGPSKEDHHVEVKTIFAH
ncbi:MAG: type IV pilus modification protein PilV [candidate division WOR-3 bacterium]